MFVIFIKKNLGLIIKMKHTISSSQGQRKRITAVCEEVAMTNDHIYINSSRHQNSSRQNSSRHRHHSKANWEMGLIQLEVTPV